MKPPEQTTLPDEGPDVGPGLILGGTIVIVAGGSALGASKSSDTAALLTFAAAILVALITWYATDRRQSAALAAEQTRHRATLLAEDGRLASQLLHAQELDDRQRLLAFLDEIAEAYEGLHQSYTRLMVLFEHMMRMSDASHQARVEQESASADRAVLEGFRSVPALLRRLSLRFAGDHQICVAMSEALGELRAGHDAYLRTEQDPWQRHEQMAKHAQAALHGFGRFADAVREDFRPDTRLVGDPRLQHPQTQPSGTSGIASLR